MPQPKLRGWFGTRSTLNRSGDWYTAGSRFAAPRSVTTEVPAGTGVPAMSASTSALRASSWTGLSNLSISSTAVAACSGWVLSRSIWSGLRRRHSVPLPMRFVVVSNPAAKRRMAVEIISSVVSLSPPSSTWTIAEIKSLRGAAVRCATRSPKYELIVLIACSADSRAARSGDASIIAVDTRTRERN